jgi:hypothetical protein
MGTKLRDLAKAVVQLAPDSELKKPKSGSHWKFVRPKCRPYPVPAHNGDRSEVGDTYIAGLCRCLHLDHKALVKMLSS